MRWRAIAVVFPPALDPAGAQPRARAQDRRATGGMMRAATLPVLAAVLGLAGAASTLHGEETISGPDAAKEIVRQYVDAFNHGDLERLRRLFAPDAVIQGVLKKGQMDEILPIWKELHEGLAASLEIEEIIAEGDVVAVRYTERGTFRAPFFGNPPTGRSYELVAMEWFVVREGRIQQRWGARDAASQARQIGLPLK